MKIRSALVTLALCGAASAAGSAGLTPAETRWVAAAMPVLDYAREQRLPLDIVVQPQDTPGMPPVAIGFVDGRCKLVLSMRGNPRAQQALAGVAPALLPAVVEAMTAHEIGHCWRHVHGRWQTLPAGFVDADVPRSAAQLERWRREMRSTRREEGFADLVGLAWIQHRRPAQYAQVHAWLSTVRDDGSAPGSHHDTRAWLRLAGDGHAWPSAGNVFEQAQALWQRGLGDEDAADD